MGRSVFEAPRPVDPLDDEMSSWITTPLDQDRHRTVLGALEAEAKKRGVDRRAFLGTTAGFVTALGVAYRSSAKPIEQPPAPAAWPASCFDATSVGPPGAGFRAGFTRVDQSTRAEWLRIGMATIAQQQAVPQVILGMLHNLDGFFGGFKVHQLDHARQTATLALRANANDETVLSALLHDVGKVVSIEGHPEIAASMLRPYVASELYHVIRTHQDFQGRHYYAFLGRPTTLRDQYVNEPWYGLAEAFTDQWDQAAFDPSYPSLPLADFEPLVYQFFGKQPTWSSPAFCG